MATNAVEILLQLRDEASRGLREVGAEVDKVGDAAGDAAAGVDRFNRETDRTRIETDRTKRSVADLQREVRTLGHEHRAGLTSASQYRAALASQERELRQLIPTLDRSTTEYEQAAAALAATRAELDRLTPEVDEATNAVQRHGQVATQSFGAIQTSLNAIVTGEAFRRYVRFLNDAALLAHQARAAHALFEKQLRNTNQSLDEGAALVERLADRFGVAESVIEDAATLLLRQGASLRDIERLFTAAGASAAAAGFDITTSFENVAIAVATGRSELLETSGIVTNLGPVTQRFAASIGKTVDELSDAEIIQARVNAIWDETKGEIDDVDILLQGLPRSQAAVSREWRQMRQDTGELAERALRPLYDALAGILGFLNRLPQPVKDFGVAASGAALGVIALSNAVRAVRTALLVMNVAGAAAFGPVGWVALGVGVVAGLVAALTGRGDSLDAAIDKASEALASGDKTSFLSALDAVIEKSSGEMKTSLSDLRDELVATGDVAVEQAERILFALAKSRLQLPQPGPLGLRTEGSPLREGLMAAETFGVTNALDRTIAALEQGDRIAAMLVLAQAGQVLAEAATRGQAQLPWVEAVQALWDEVATIPQRAAEMVEDFKPPPIEPPPGGDGGNDDDEQQVDKVAQRIAALDAEIAALQREAGLGLLEPGELTEAIGKAVESAAHDLIRLGASDEVVRQVLDRAAPVRLAIEPTAEVLPASFAPGSIFRQFEDHLERETLRLAERLDSMDITTTNTDLAIQRERELAMQREQAARDAAILLAEFAESERRRAQQLRFSGEAAQTYTDQLVLQGKAAALAAREGISLGEALDKLIITESEAAAAGRDDRFRPNDFTADRNGARAQSVSLRTIANNIVAEVTTALEGVPISFQPGSIFRQFEDHLERETLRLAERLDSMDITTTNTDLAIQRERELAMQREQAARDAAILLAEFAESERRRAQQLRFSGEAAQTYTDQLVLQGKAAALAAREGISLTEALDRLIITAEEAAAAAEDDRFRFNDFTTSTDEQRDRDAEGNLSEAELEARRRRQERVDEFTAITGDNSTLVNVRNAIVDLVVQAIPALQAAIDKWVETGSVSASLVAAFQQLLGQSEAFRNAIEAVQAALEPLAELLGTVLAPVIRFLANVISGVVHFIVGVWNFLFGWIPGLRINLNEPKKENDGPTHSDEPPEAPSTDFSSVSGGVQLGVAVPLREAAELQLSAAQLQMQAAQALAGAVTLLVEKGVNVNSAPAAPQVTTFSQLIGLISRAAVVRP